MNRTEREEEPLINQALDNAYDSNFEPKNPTGGEYPPLERSKELIQAMLDNPQLKLGELAVEGGEDDS